jgi:hypothetical protein
VTRYFIPKDTLLRLNNKCQRHSNKCKRSEHLRSAVGAATAIATFLGWAGVALIVWGPLKCDLLALSAAVKKLNFRSGVTRVTLGARMTQMGQDTYSRRAEGHSSATDLERGRCEAALKVKLAKRLGT